MRKPDFRTPVIGVDTVEHQVKLLKLWETGPGIVGFFTSVDHKQIGIRYIVTAFVFLALGGIEALLMRLQLAGPNLSLLTPEQYNQLFSTHDHDFSVCIANLVGFLQLFVASLAG
jgi:heme/copper-type cytochrome/quinol oxidase subunit 1